MPYAKRYQATFFKWSRKRGWLFYLFLLPLFFSVIFALFSMQIHLLTLNSIGFILMYFTMLVASKGFEQESVYNEAALIQAPKVPYKLIAALLLALTTFHLLYIVTEHTLFKSIFLSFISAVGFILYYGKDPSEDKLRDFGDISSSLVLEMLSETQSKISQIRAEAEKIEDEQLYESVDRAIEKSRNIFNILLDNPEEIRTARRFLIVFLDGVSDVIYSYNRIEKGKLSMERREKLLSVMSDVEERFDKELLRLKSSHLFELDVNIETLKTQINN